MSDETESSGNAAYVTVKNAGPFGEWDVSFKKLRTDGTFEPTLSFELDGSHAWVAKRGFNNCID